MLTALQDPFLPNPFAADSEVTPQCGSTQAHTGCTHDFDPNCTDCVAGMETLWDGAVHAHKLSFPYTVILPPDVAEHLKSTLGALPDYYKVVDKIPDFHSDELAFYKYEAEVWERKAKCAMRDRDAAEDKYSVLQGENAILRKQLAALQPNMTNFPQLITGNKLGKSTASQREREVCQRLQREFPEVKAVKFESIDFDHRIAMVVRLGGGRGLSSTVDKTFGLDSLALLEADMRQRLTQNRALLSKYEMLPFTNNQSNDFMKLGMVAAGTEVTTGLLNDMVAKQQQAQCGSTSPGQPPDYNAETALCQAYKDALIHGTGISKMWMDEDVKQVLQEPLFNAMYK